MKLKFRVWEGEKYLSLSKALKEGLVGVQYDRDDSFELESYYEHVTIEMFTGCKDNKGIEIYCGDKIKKYCHIYRDIYDNHSFGFVDTETEFEGFIYGVVRFVPSLGFTIKQTHSIDMNDETELKLKGYTPIVSSRVEVIGNIHDKEVSE